MIKIAAAALIAVLMLAGSAKACDIDAARASAQSAAVNADDASSADSLDDAQSAANDAESAAQSAAAFLSDCDSN